PKTATANWKTQYLLTVLTDPSGLSPQPTRNPAGEAGPSNGWWYDATTSVTLTAEPIEGYIFSYWDVDDVSQGSGVNRITVEMNAPHTATAHYTLAGPGTVTITFNQTGVGSDFTGIVLNVDGNGYNVSDLPVSFTWDIGSSHTFNYYSPLEIGANNKRYVWTSTTGLSTQQSGTITASTPGNVIGNYKTQFYLTVTSDYGSPTPTSGWFDAGTEVTASVTSPWPIGATDIRYVCIGWTGTGSVPASGIGTTVAFAINAPSSITWNWKTQYLLTMSANYGIVSPSSGWYDASSVVIISAFAPASISGERYIWLGWTGIGIGSYTGSENPAQIVMNGPIDETASWAHQFYLTVASPYGTAGGEGWYDEGDLAYATVHPLLVEGPSGLYYVFTHWSGDATGASSPSDPIIMNAPKTAIANWEVANCFVTFDANGLDYNATGIVVTVNNTGITIGELPYTLWVRNGTLVTYEYNPIILSTSLPGKRFSLIGITGPESPMTVTGPTFVTANYVTQYRLTVASDHDTPMPSVGEHWFDAGALVEASVTSPTDEDQGLRYRCTGWTGTGSVPASGYETTIAFIIDAPSGITWNWIAQYYLSLATEPPGIATPSGEGWYDANSYASISTPESVETSLVSSRYRFFRWTSEDMSEISEQFKASTMVKMDKAKTVIANYTVQYAVNLETSGLGSDFSGSSIVFDGYGYRVYDASPARIWVDMGKTVDYAWSSPISSMVSGKRYVITTPKEGSLTVDSPKILSATYKTQYYLKVLSEYGRTSGEGWYDKGSIAYAGLDRGEVVLQEAIYFFVAWTGDASGTNYNRSDPITMSGPKTAIANWSAKFYLTLNTNPPGIATPSGEGWYVEGTYASISTPKYVYTEDGLARYVFSGWETEAISELIDPSNASTRVLMDMSKTVTANYRLQYLLTVTASPLEASGGTFKIAYTSLGVKYPALEPKATPWIEWMDANTTVALSDPQAFIPDEEGLEGVRYRFVDYEPSQNVTMDAPKIIILEYTVQYSINFDYTGVGSDFQGSIVTIDEVRYNASQLPRTFWWDEGTLHRFAYEGDLPVDAGKRYSWMNTTGLLELQEATFNVTDSGSITANYETLYYLNVLSDYGNPYGSGWYPQNSKAKFGVTTPIDHGNRTLRVFIKWSGDAEVYTPEGTIVVLKPSVVIATWQKQYLVTFNTTLPDRRILSIPKVPELRPPGFDVFGMYYPAGEIVTVGPAPLIEAGAEGTRYAFEGWNINGQPFTKDLVLSLVVDRPYDVSVAYGIEHLLSVKALGVKDPFIAKVTIAAIAKMVRDLTPTTSVSEWMPHGTQTALGITTPNKIGHGEWAIFGEWSGDAQGRNRNLSFVMDTSKTLNAIFFKVNPVAESIPYSLLSGVVCLALSCLIAKRKRKEKGQRMEGTELQKQGYSQSQAQTQNKDPIQAQMKPRELELGQERKKLRKTSLPWALGVIVAIVALIVAAFVSITVASGYGINANELLDFTNWAVVFLAIEALVFLFATKFLTAWIYGKGSPEAKSKAEVQNL
ncbi:MAG: hypothetical protein QXO94_05565, partial [Candidatus Bathyarchaeia archaeon]